MSKRGEVRVFRRVRETPAAFLPLHFLYRCCTRDMGTAFEINYLELKTAGDDNGWFRLNTVVLVWELLNV